MLPSPFSLFSLGSSSFPQTAPYAPLLTQTRAHCTSFLFLPVLKSQWLVVFSGFVSAQLLWAMGTKSMQKCSAHTNTFSPVVLDYHGSRWSSTHSGACVFARVPQPSYILGGLIVHSPFVSVLNCELVQKFLRGAPLLTRSQLYEPQLPHVGWAQASPGSFPHGISVARWGLWQEMLPFNSPLVCPLVNKGCTHLPSTWKPLFAKGCFTASSNPHKPSKLNKAAQLNLLVHVVL